MFLIELIIWWAEQLLNWILIIITYRYLLTIEWTQRSYKSGIDANINNPKNTSAAGAQEKNIKNFFVK